MIKRISGLTAFMLLSIIFIAMPGRKAQAQDVEVSYQSFYDELAPYGQWVSDPNFGDVFVPNVPMGFKPYASDGYWAMTDQGNMWMSNEPWGWACYHYGRWTYNGYYGWVWIPGYQWAPAWVSWRTGGGYYGWAPMGPGYIVGGVYNYPDNYWSFVAPGYLYRPNVYEYYGHEDPGFYIGHSSYLTETYGRGGDANYYYGPRAEVIERETNQPVQVYRVANSNQPGVAHMGGNQVSIYRPAVNQASLASAHPANLMPGEDHPIGRAPEPVSRTHQTAQPAFRQQMQAAPQQRAQPGNQPRSQLQSGQSAKPLPRVEPQQAQPQQQHTQPEPQPQQKSQQAQPQQQQRQPQQRQPQKQGQQKPQQQKKH